MLRSESPILKTITEMATKYGVTQRALRFYEQRGFLSPIRTGSMRLYTSKDEIKLQLIQTGKKLGFTLIEIERMIVDRTKIRPGGVNPDKR